MTREQVDQYTLWWLEHGIEKDFGRDMAIDLGIYWREKFAKSFVTGLFNNAQQLEIAKLKASAHADTELDEEMEAACRAATAPEPTEGTHNAVWVPCPCDCHKPGGSLHYECPQRCTEGKLLSTEEKVT